MHKILLLAPLVSHATLGRISALKTKSCKLALLDTSSRTCSYDLNKYPFSLIDKYFFLNAWENDPFYMDRGIKSHLIDYFRSKCWISENKSTLDRIKKVIDTWSPDIVVCFYGSGAAHFARMIFKIRNNLPVIFITNLFPQRISDHKKFKSLIFDFIYPEFSDYKFLSKKISMWISASDLMSKYLVKRLNINLEDTKVIPDYFPSSISGFSLKKKKFDILANTTKRPKRLIFLGAPERWGGNIDSLDNEFIEIASDHLEIWAGEVNDNAHKNTRVFKYPKFSDQDVFDGKLCQFAREFDAAIITYAISQRFERFSSTLPTRFLIALAAGVPIAVKKGLFDAVEIYIERSKLGFSYENPHELSQNLNNEKKMLTYRKNAIRHAKSMNAETQNKKFSEIINLILN